MAKEHIIHIDVAELAAQAGFNHDVLVTRAYGRQFLPVLEARLRDLSETNALVLDFEQVQIMDASFADEVFGSIAVSRSRRTFAGGCLVLSALRSANLDNLTMALTSRTVRETSLRNCVVPVDEGRGTVTLAGKVESHVAQTFAILSQRKTLTARELSDGLQRDIAAASTRLKVLYDLGLAIRTETRDAHGKQYVYRWPL